MPNRKDATGPGAARAGRGRPRRRLLRGVGLAVLTLVLLAAIGWTWVLPVVIRSEIRKQVARAWQGQVEIGSLSLAVDGSLYIRDAQLLGPRGRCWLRLEEATIELGDWPSLKPTIRNVRARKLDLRGYFDDGEMVLPVHPVDGDGDGGLKELESVEVGQVSLAVNDDSGKVEQWDDFSASLRRKGRQYEVAVYRPSNGPPGQISILGQLDPQTLETSLRVYASLDVQRRYGQVVLAALDVPEVDAAEGRLHADLSVTGRLDQPLWLEAKGTLFLGDWRMSSRGSAVIDDMDLDVRIDGLEGQVTQGGIQAGPWAVQVEDIRFSVDRRNRSLSLNLALSSRWHTDQMSTFWRQVMAEVEGTGQLDLRGPLRLSLDTGELLEADLAGPVRASSLSIPLRPPLLLADLDGELTIKPTMIRLHKLLGRVWDGRLEGAASAMRITSATQPFGRPTMQGRAVAAVGTRPAGPAAINVDNVVFSGDLILTNVNMMEVTRQFQEHDPSRQGRGSASGKLSIRGLDIQSLGGKVVVFMDDVEAFRLPVLSQILTFLRVENETSDFHGTFNLEGLTATIEQARLASRLSALVAEPGGTIVLDQGQMNFYIVAVPLSAVRDLLLKIPLVNLLVNVRDKLTRLQVKGQWDDPAAKLLKVQPIENVEEGTLTFFRDVARSGGQIGGEVVKTLRDIIELPFGGGKKKNAGQ